MNFEPIAYDPDEALKLENQICFPLYAAARKVIGAYTPLLKPLGITYTQYITFMILWENDGITVGEIGSRLHLDNGTLTPMLKKMEKEGFIERRRSLEDERKVDVFLTDSGREKKEKARNIPLEAGKCINISKKKKKTLYNILYGIIDADKKK